MPLYAPFASIVTETLRQSRVCLDTNSIEFYALSLNKHYSRIVIPRDIYSLSKFLTE